ncbi:hypothetical protein L5515_009386 [Caenorhabditis briggsae]|uniref:Uncharacterized protein n=1 Tax=Caenorhabditis briggsae TaxID=6238 RepID=A0AAE9JNV0_CAEBR|nr:hypothetical protein L5515_009386 [Caenorhabditis briggsae]
MVVSAADQFASTLSHLKPGVLKSIEVPFREAQLQELEETLLKLHHIESWYFPPIYPIDYHAIYNRFGPIEDGGARDLDIPNTNAYYKIIFGWEKTSMKKRIY